MNERDLTDEMKAAVAAPIVRPAFFYYADFPDGILRMWSGVGNIEWDGETWLGCGNLLSIEEVTETTDSAQHGLRARFSGIPSEIVDPVLIKGYVGREAKFWLVAFDENDAVISEPYLMFSGKMDSDSIIDDGSTVTVTIEIQGELSDHLKARVSRYTHEDQQTRYPDAGDEGFEFVAALQTANIEWGRPTTA